MKIKDVAEVRFGGPIRRGDGHVKLRVDDKVWQEANHLRQHFGVAFRMRIGIHYGEAITGNIGTELRKQFSIVGNVVIQASRILT